MFLVVGIQLPFWPIWLAARGLSAREIGIVLAAAIWVKVLRPRRLARSPIGWERSVR
jgi:PPP family 3-phenylpropionic acid transporter